MELREIHLAYLRTLNERRFDDLAEFVHDEVTYNDERWTLEQYRELLVEDVSEIPDLRYEVDSLVVEGDVVACRLWFDCHPRHAFHGIQVDGRRVAFAEHAFYRFRAGRIERVRSLIDLDSVRRQLTNGR